MRIQFTVYSMNAALITMKSLLQVHFIFLGSEVEKDSSKSSNSCPASFSLFLIILSSFRSLIFSWTLYLQWRKSQIECGFWFQFLFCILFAFFFAVKFINDYYHFAKIVAIFCSCLRHMFTFTCIHLLTSYW